MPDVLLGDMDSISDESFKTLQDEGIKIIKFPAEKDKTDGEISLDYAKEIGAEYVDMVCVEGSIDHYLGNLYLLMYAKKIGVKAKLITDDMTVWASDGKEVIYAKKGTRVSVLPADGEITVLEPSGLYYPLLKPQKIMPGDTLGLGNHMTDKKCVIEVLKGTAFIFVERN
jgi:thiamine pyrophosphokinase